MHLNAEDTKLFLKELLKTVVYLSAIVIVVRFFILQPFVVKGMSMEPNLDNNNYLFVNEISYRFGHPDRGDVVVFRHPENACNDFIENNWFNRTFRQGPCINYIKRVIGLPGETVIVKNGTVTIKNEQSPQGFILNETYIPADIKLLGDQTVTVPRDNYFVLGDNRLPNASSDSREWGTLPRKNIIGKAWLRVIPLNEFGIVKEGEY